MDAMKRVFRGAEEEIAWEESACASCRDRGASCTHFAPTHIIVDRDRVVTRYVGRMPLLPTQLPMLDGSWAWLRKCNEDLHRATRADASELLLTALKCGGYAVRCGGRTHTVKFKSLDKMRQGTQVLSDERGLPKLPPCPGHAPLLDHFAGGSPVEKAVELTREGFRVACVSASSAYSAGGGFKSGGRHALEEALCTQSTLYGSLDKVVQLFAARRLSYRIPEGGVVISPNVEVFRNGTDQGYPVYGGRETLEIAAVISMAMYNCNPRVRDSPVDAPNSNREYEEGVRRKFVAMVHGAIIAGADALVLPDIGCGVFGNDATTVGAIAGRALRGYTGHFKAIVFTGNRAFHDAAMKSMMEFAIQLRERARSKTELLAPSSRCLVCNERLGKDLAVLLGPTGERALLRFLHEGCSELLADRWPDHTAMTLPRAAETPEDFLQALDVDGNGTVSKDELRCVVVALMGGEDPNPAQFEERWKEWDADDNGFLDLAELRQMCSPSGRPRDPRAPGDATGPSAEAADATAARLPRGLLEWVRARASMEAQASSANPALAL